MVEAGAHDTVRIEKTGTEHVLLVRIERPGKRNALDDGTRTALVASLQRAVDDGARAVVLTGTDGSFAAGADLRELADRSPQEQRAAMAVPRMYEAIEALPAPVIAAINGDALGAGLELALACDLRLASSTARVGSPEVRLGLIPGGGATQRLPRLIGLGQASRLILTGELIEAEEAHRLGMVEEVLAPDALEPRAIELAGRMARWSPVALSAAKRALRASWNAPLNDGLRTEIDQFVRAFRSRDAAEGIGAFLEKREPRFEGR